MVNTMFVHISRIIPYFMIYFSLYCAILMPNGNFFANKFRNFYFSNFVRLLWLNIEKYLNFHKIRTAENDGKEIKV